MSSSKGYPSKERDLSLATSDTFVTGEPIREKQHGLSVNAHMFVSVIGADAVEAASTTTVINATAHAAKVGDVISFTSGALNTQEVKVRSITANSITVAETLPSVPATSVTFDILRHKYPVVNAAGELSVSIGSVDVDLDESTDSITVFGNDGGTNRVLKTDANGELQIDVLSSALPTGAATSANQSLEIGELQDIEADIEASNVLLGTIDADTSNISTKIDTLAGAVSGSEMQVDVISSALPTGASTSANQSLVIGELQDIEADVEASNVLLGTIDADTSNISTKIDTLAGAVSGSEVQVDIVSAPTLTVQATDLDVRDLTHVSDSVKIGDGTNLAAVNGSNELATNDASANTSLSTLAGAVAGTEVQVDIVSAPTLTVQATDLDIRDLASGTDSVSAVQSGAWNITNVSGTVSLPTGAATEATLSSIDTSLNNLEAAVSGSELQVDVITLPGTVEADIAAIKTAVETTAAEGLLDVLSFARLDYSSSNVTTGAYVQLIASTGAATKKLHIFDSSGQTIYLAIGAAASEVDKLLIIPGGNGEIEVTIPVSSRISLKAVSGTADAGEIVVNLLG